jgi:hypothetical protein
MHSAKLESLHLETLYQENLLQNKKPTTPCETCFFITIEVMYL